LEGIRGPRLACISPARVLKSQPKWALIQEYAWKSDGTRLDAREVPKDWLLPWTHGLLLLDALEHRRDEVPWYDKRLQAILSAARQDALHEWVDGADFVRGRWSETVATGPGYGDQGTCWRRLVNKAKDDVSKVGPGGEFFNMLGVAGYLPPWEAFCHRKCGFYQDFYLVRWDSPYSEEDYSLVENGCGDLPGATWEPDECLPAELNDLRIQAKRAWVEDKITLAADSSTGSSFKRRAISKAWLALAGGNPERKACQRPTAQPSTPPKQVFGACRHGRARNVRQPPQEKAQVEKGSKRRRAGKEDSPPNLSAGQP